MASFDISAPLDPLTVAACLRARHDQICLVVSPPRCGSTVLARALWEHPRMRYYCHEHFDLVYHRGEEVTAAYRALLGPIDFAPLTRVAAAGGRGLIVKEMTFQVGERFSWLAGLSRRAVVFCIRDPRSAVASRMRQRTRGGQPPLFPAAESGWDVLVEQVEIMRATGRPYLVVDALDLRQRPAAILRAVCGRLGLRFHESLLAWRPVHDLALGQLGAEQRHWYEQVLASSGFIPDATAPVDLDAFPDDGGFRDHVRDCVTLYQQLLADPNRV